MFRRLADLRKQYGGVTTPSAASEPYINEFCPTRGLSGCLNASIIAHPGERTCAS